MSWAKSDFGFLAGMGILFAGLGTCDYLTCLSCSKLDSRLETPAAITQQHVLGHEQPEVYIVQDGTPYFSHIDEKSVAYFVRECYQPEEQPPRIEPVSP